VIFNVVSENVQKPHVAEKMPEAGVEEHEREKRDDLLPCAEISGNLGYRVPRRHKAVGVDEPIEPRPLQQLNQEEEHIGGDDQGIGDRKVPGPVAVANGYHVLLSSVLGHGHGED
jgi:hypothetical protein